MTSTIASAGSIRVGGIVRLMAAAVCLCAGIAHAADEIEEIVVTSQRREQPRLEHDGNIDRLGVATIGGVGHQHIQELLTRVPGVWLVRASGQEHLTAIRSPVLSGAGSCGAFLFLEDGIPIRPAGFCNVNSMFEVNTEQAEAIEVIRGPGNALYGANALHGVINTLMPAPGGGPATRLALEAGANDFVRGRMQIPFSPDSDWLLSAMYDDDGGFRDDSGYRQGKLNLKRAWEGSAGDFTAALSYTTLDQQTAGYIVGRNSYKDPSVNRSNANPEAFRKGSSLRLYGLWNRRLSGIDVDVRPYVRFTDMEFLQHFLPGKPLEENGHTSAGALVSATLGSDRRRVIVGVDLEWADMFLKETQDQPTVGSAFLMETRPVGKHYDYRVASYGIAPYVQADFRLADRWTLGTGLRIDHIDYDYDNRMLDGNTRDDGSVCGFGGCLYTRPADRGDRYTNIAPKLSLGYRIADTSRLYAVLARGFRPPQATELYRLQSGQDVADLESERIDSLEIGWRRSSDGTMIDVAAFAMRKRDSVFRDAEGFNVSGGRTLHRGVEFGLDWQAGERLAVDVDLSYARHTYDFDVVAGGGETFTSGNDVDTAPRWLGSVEFNLAVTPRLDTSLQFTGVGRHYVDAENRFSHPGHVVGNFRARLALSPQFAVTARLNNIADRDIADRADYAFGDYRYFPGRGRELFVEIGYTPRSLSP